MNGLPVSQSPSASPMPSVAAVRRAIAAGEFTPAAMRAWLSALPEAERDGAVDNLFELDPFVPDAADLPPGCVPYLAAPVSALIAVADALALNRDGDAGDPALGDNAVLGGDAAFVDIGCGVGRAVMLVHLLTGVDALGVEVQPHLVGLGRSAAQRLSLSRVQLLHGDACDVQVLPEGSVYFLYCPFDAARVKRVLSILELRARRRDIMVACLHVKIPENAWLLPVGSDAAGLQIHRSRRA